MTQQVQALPLKTDQTKKEFTPQKIEKLIAVFSPMPLIKYPYFVSLGRRNRKREIYYEETTRDGIKVKWTVKSRDYLPGEMEFKVWCWILHKVSEAHKPLPPDFYIPYTLTEIAKYWDLSIKGKTISLIAKAINNLRTTDVHHLEQKPLVDLAYSLLADRAGEGENEDKEILNKNVIFLGPVLIRSLNKGVIKPSSLEQLKSLADGNLIAARLYELLGWRFYINRINGSETINFMYSDLIKRIGIKLEKYKSDAKRQFTKAHKYLKKNKIISSDPVWYKIKNDWKITYKPTENLIMEISEWVRRKKIKRFTTQIKCSDPEIDYALEEIETYLGEGEQKVFLNLVKKIFKNKKNGFEVVVRAISEVKAEESSKKIENPAAYLTTILKKYTL